MLAVCVKQCEYPAQLAPLLIFLLYLHDTHLCYFFYSAVVRTPSSDSPILLFFRDASGGANATVASLAGIINGLRSSSPAPPTVISTQSTRPLSSTTTALPAKQTLPVNSTQVSGSPTVSTATPVLRRNGPSPASSLQRNTSLSSALGNRNNVANSISIASTTTSTTSSTAVVGPTASSLPTQSTSNNSFRQTSTTRVPTAAVSAESHGESGLVAAPHEQSLHYNGGASGLVAAPYDQRLHYNRASGLVAHQSSAPLAKTSYFRYL